MTSFTHSDDFYQLLASRVNGTQRQLWIHRDNDIDNENILDDEFQIRPIETRKKFDLANKIGDLLSFSNLANTIDRVNMIECSINEFTESYIIPQKPVLILDCTKNSIWPAGSEYWKPETLLNSLGVNRRFEVKDANATVSLDDFIKYSRSKNCLEDDNPAYLWETLIDCEHDDIISKFQTPKYFTENGKGGIHSPGDGADLLSDAGEDGSLFGLHRWILMGPGRSGSNLHIDPLNTSAWNTLLLGNKYWVVFPPGLPEEYFINASKSVNLVSDNNEIYPSDYCSSSWFLLVLPFIESEVLNGNWPEEFQPQKFIQYEGETIYIPAGWWHAVLNIDFTVCVTQNIAEVCNYSNVAKEIYNENEISSEDADEWRLKVYNRLPEINDLVSNYCVHCNAHTNGNICKILSERPVCKSCENERDEYNLISSINAQKLYGISIWKLSREETPPHVVKCDNNGRESTFFLLDHIKSISGITETIIEIKKPKIKQPKINKSSKYLKRRN